MHFYLTIVIEALKIYSWTLLSNFLGSNYNLCALLCHLTVLTGCRILSLHILIEPILNFALSMLVGIHSDVRQAQA